MSIQKMADKIPVARTVLFGRDRVQYIPHKIKPGEIIPCDDGYTAVQTMYISRENLPK